MDLKCFVVCAIEEGELGLVLCIVSAAERDLEVR